MRASTAGAVGLVRPSGKRQPRAYLPQRGVLIRSPHHVGVGPAQVGHADSYPMMCHLRAEGVGEGLHARLARAVGRHHRGGGERGQRGHLEQVAPAFEQGGQEGAGGGHAAEQVDLDDPRERAGVAADERAADGDSGVGDDDVDPVAGVADRGGDVRERALVGDVDLPPAGVMARNRRTRGRARPVRGRAGPLARYERPGVSR